MEIENKEKQYTTEQQCREYIASVKWKNGFVCPVCNYHEAWITNENKYKCKKCNHKTSVTSDTIFQDSHISLPIWFEGIKYISSETASVTVRDFQQILGVSSIKTAHNILNRIKKALRYPHLNKLSGTVELFKIEAKINNKNIDVILGAENKKSRIGRIRIQPIRQGVSDDVIDFVKSCIEPNSTLICKDYWAYNLKLLDGYKFLSKQDVLQLNKKLRADGEEDKQLRYLCIDRLRNKFNINSRDTDIDLILNKICVRENLYKEQIPFDMIMEYAVNPKRKTSKNTKSQKSPTGSK